MNIFLQESYNQKFQTPLMIFQDKEETKQYYIFSKTKYIIIKQESEQQQKYIKEHTYQLPKQNIFYQPKQLTNFLQQDLKTKLQFLYQVESILGIISDKNQSFLILLEQSIKIGQIFQHEILKAESFKLLQLRMDLQTDIKDKQFSYIKNYFENELKNYIFSYTYNLDKSLQMNMLKFNNDSRLNFVVNKQLLKNIYHLVEDQTSFQENDLIKNWTVNLINGYFNSYLFEESQMLFEIIILTRRETSNLGTRYNRRGLNDRAFAANFVEVEQIVINKTLSNFKNPICSSYVQIRASVPLYWHQNIKTFDPKPKIQINKYSEAFHAFRIHLSDLCKRYGQNIQICNLLFSRDNQSASRKTEINLSEKFQEYFNQYFKSLKGLNMINYDIKKSMKEKKDVYEELKKLHNQTNQDVGFFIFTKYQSFTKKQNLNYFQIQKGVIRSNCVDCIDRTNIAQTIFSKIILEKQIKHLIFFKNSKEKMDIDIKLHIENEFLDRLDKFWREIGDQIAQHYAGSKAHDINSTGKTGILVKRYLCNVFGDDYKQKFLNLLQNNFEESSNEFILSQKLLYYSLDNDKILKLSIKNFLQNLNKFEQFEKRNSYICKFEELCKILQIDIQNVEQLQQKSLKTKIESIQQDIQKIKINKLNKTLQNIEKTNEFKTTYDQKMHNIQQNKNEMKQSFQKTTKRKTYNASSKNKKNKKLKKNKFSAFFKRSEKFQPFSNFNQRSCGRIQKIEIGDFLEEWEQMYKNNSLKKIDLLQEMKDLENSYKNYNNQFYYLSIRIYQVVVYLATGFFLLCLVKYNDQRQTVTQSIFLEKSQKFFTTISYRKLTYASNTQIRRILNFIYRTNNKER